MLELSTHADFPLVVVRKMDAVHPAAGQKDGSPRVLNRDCRKDDGEQPTPLLQLPPLYADWCAVWRSHAAELHSSTYLADFSFFNVCTYGSEFTVAPLSKIPSLSKVALAMTVPAELPIHSFHSLSYDMSTASSKASSEQSAF